jgi:nitronate monooxygenase
MGTRFIASAESAAPAAYKQMVVDSGIDDIELTDAFTGLPANMLTPSLRAAGIALEGISPANTAASAARIFGEGGADESPRRWRDIWSAGHSVDSADAVLPAAELIELTRRQFRAAAAASLATPWVAATGDDPP